MQQRLSVARVLLHDPKVLLMDEPASGLDPRARIEMRELLKELRRMGKTILISSHILPELAELCNVVGIIERGQLLFNGPADNPRLDILALRPNLDQRVGVLVSGSAQLPRVRLYSDPEMSETDTLSWLVLGRAPDGLARADTALLQHAALALLAGEGQSPDQALLANIGLDELSVRQTESGDVKDTVVTVGKQLSRHWYVGYERGINATTGTWQLIYRIAQRLTLRAQAGEDNALDAIWTWRWN
jgi:translocation and assembly module TamB